SPVFCALFSCDFHTSRRTPKYHALFSSLGWHVGDVGDPELVRLVGAEVPLHQAWSGPRLRIARGDGYHWRRLTCRHAARVSRTIRLRPPRILCAASSAYALGAP